MKKYLLVLLILLLCGCSNKVKPFYLDDAYYKESNFIEIDVEEFKKLEKNKNSFVLLVYQNGCSTSTSFCDLVGELSKDKNIIFYQMSFQKTRKTSIKKYLEYYPSIIIFKEGKMVTYLKSDSDDDIIYYESIYELTNWFDSYILER